MSKVSIVAVLALGSLPLAAHAEPALPAGGRAVATFESLGLYWKPPSDPGAAGCTVRYRKSGDSAWKEGLAMWYDSRNSECRGSLVHLSPDTQYEVQLGVPGEAPSVQLGAKTWSEQLPIARTVLVESGGKQVNITQGGSAGGYVLYTAPAGTTLDVDNAATHNIVIGAPYVIVRGLTLKGAKEDAIRFKPGAHDVVIEDNDISGWGTLRGTNSAGWQLGVNYQAAVRAECGSERFNLERVVVQRNRIHHPRYGANSWSDGHPLGPQGITFTECGGNHVFRYNEIYSSDQRYFNDGIGGGNNFSAKGFPNADSDLYGNKISQTWDDGIEAEGGNMNVRVWGNYIDQTSVAIASTPTHSGPLYIFRNVYNRSRQRADLPLDFDQRGSFAKAGAAGGYGGGRRYLFHNTLLQAAQPPGTRFPLGAGAGLAGNSGQPLTNTVSRNNIWQVWKPNWASINEAGGRDNDLDYDLYNGRLLAYPGAERHGIAGAPRYAPGHGAAAESRGLYQLSRGSPGYDRGERIPNFNDAFSGAAPDIGAHEAGSPPMRFGVPAP